MQMHLLSGGRVRTRKSTYLPATDRAETIELPVVCALLRHRQGNVLFDTGCHPEVATDATRWGGLARVMTPIMAADDNVVAGLKGLGLAPDDVDNTWDAVALEKSLVEIRRIAGCGATVICGHDDRQWRTLRKGADAYD